MQRAVQRVICGWGPARGGGLAQALHALPLAVATVKLLEDNSRLAHLHTEREDLSAACLAQCCPMACHCRDAAMNACCI